MKLGILALLAGLVLIGSAAAISNDVTIQGTVPSILSFTPPVGGSMPTLTPAVAQPITKPDSFAIQCNGAWVVTATSEADVMAANGHMLEWDPLLVLWVTNGHMLQNSMHLVGTGTNAFGDKDLAVIGIELVSGTGTPLTTYNFNWAQTVSWADYPDTPYNLKVEFSANRVP